MGLTSPEVPLRKITDELKSASQDMFELLPVASVDLKLSCEPEIKDCDLESSQGSESSTGAPRTESAQSEQSREILEANGVSEVDASQMMWNASESHSTLTIQPMLCLMQRELNGVMRVIPCMGDAAYAQGEQQIFWCHVQRQQDGSAVISPCTNAEDCGVTTDANGSQLKVVHSRTELLKNSSYAPIWVFGPQWPYCVAPTTLMLTELPEDLCQEDFIELLDKDDFSGFYDFVTLPTELGSDRNFTYAIVNFTRHEYALSFSAKANRRTTWGASHGSKECQVSWSLPMQGVSELINQYRYHPSNGDDVPSEKRPAYFSKGWPAPFPQSS